MNKNEALNTLKENLCMMCAYMLSNNMDTCNISYCDNKNALETITGLLEQTEWIPVTERLPEKTGLYLTNIGDLVTTMSFDGHTFSAWGQPIAWMPLPKPYKEDEDERSAN